MNVGVHIYVIFMMIIFATQIVNSIYMLATINEECDSDSLRSNLRGMLVVGCIGLSGFFMYYLCQKCKPDELTTYAKPKVYGITIILGIAMFIFSIGVHGKITDKTSDKCRVKNEYTAKLFTGIAGIGGSLITIALSAYWLYDSRNIPYRQWLAKVKKQQVQWELDSKKRDLQRLKNRKKNIESAGSTAKQVAGIRDEIKDVENEIKKLENERVLRRINTNSTINSNRSSNINSNKSSDISSDSSVSGIDLDSDFRKRSGGITI